MPLLKNCAAHNNGTILIISKIENMYSLFAKNGCYAQKKGRKKTYDRVKGGNTITLCGAILRRFLIYCQQKS